MEKEITNEISKELNIFQKKLFRKYLIDAITRNDENNFKDVVKFIGIQWGVIRNVSNDETATDLVNNLWNNKKKILSGEYTDWTKEGRLHSYESKICFLINPNHYKIIFDSQNRESLGKSTYKAEEWQDIVNKYFEDNKLDSLSVDEIFLNDCNLWLKGKKLKEEK